MVIKIVNKTIITKRSKKQEADDTNFPSPITVDNHSSKKSELMRQIRFPPLPKKDQIGNFRKEKTEDRFSICPGKRNIT